VTKTQNELLRRSKSFKVIEIGIHRKPVCDVLLVINSNWHPISYRLGVIAAYCSNFGHCVFDPSFWGLRDNARCLYRAYWKARIEDFLLVLIELFLARGYGWGAICAKIDRQVAQLSQRDRAVEWVSYGQKWKTGTGRQHFTDIMGLSSTTMTKLASKAIEFGEKTQKKGYYAAQGHSRSSR